MTPVFAAPVQFGTAEGDSNGAISARRDSRRRWSSGKGFAGDSLAAPITEVFGQVLTFGAEALPGMVLVLGELLAPVHDDISGEGV